MSFAFWNEEDEILKERLFGGHHPLVVVNDRPC